MKPDVWRWFVPEQASTMAPWVDALLAYVTLVSLAVTLLITVVIAVFLVRYRRRSPDQRARQIPGNLRLELAWTVAPLAVMLTFFFAGAVIYARYQSPPQDAMDVFVVAKQWMWTLQHPQGPREINELHVPVGRPIRLVMTSEDVIHSFFAPAFRVKQDVLPARTVYAWFEATRPGRFRLNCAEYCGTNHSRMVGWIVVMEQPAFQEWLAGASGGVSMAEAGAELFGNLGCSQCHGATAPSLRGLYGSGVALNDGSVVVADIDYLRESILDPRAKIVAGYPPQMPTFAGQVSESAIQQLTVYIQSLSEPESAPSDAPPGSPGDTP